MVASWRSGKSLPRRLALAHTLRRKAYMTVQEENIFSDFSVDDDFDLCLITTESENYDNLRLRRPAMVSGGTRLFRSCITEDGTSSLWSRILPGLF